MINIQFSKMAKYYHIHSQHNNTFEKTLSSNNQIQKTNKRKTEMSSQRDENRSCMVLNILYIWPFDEL
jgi:hypothetical protein